MKIYPHELAIYAQVSRERRERDQQLELSPNQILQLNTHAKKVREWAQEHPRLHALMQALPFFILALIWVLLMLTTMELLRWQVFSVWIMAPIFGVLHGIWGYQWVIYGMHEGAGHGLFKHPLARSLAFHSCRLLFADPVHYRDVHHTHHRHLGSAEDGAFTHFVLPRRVIRSMLPGAGILFSNDYQIHQNPRYTRSRFFSDLIGALFLAAEVALLAQVIPWYGALAALALISPWVGMMLDRTRETLEHYCMAPHRYLGAKELGLSPLGLLIGGGPWGQPCHLTHHVAPDLNWYQQLWLHRAWRDILTPVQKRALAPRGGNWASQFIYQMKESFQLQQQLISRGEK